MKVVDIMIALGFEQDYDVLESEHGESYREYYNIYEITIGGKMSTLHINSLDQIRDLILRKDEKWL